MFTLRDPHFPMLVFWALTFVICLAVGAQERTINLDPPGEREFIVDRAGLISDADKE